MFGFSIYRWAYLTAAAMLRKDIPVHLFPAVAPTPYVVRMELWWNLQINNIAGFVANAEKYHESFIFQISVILQAYIDIYYVLLSYTYSRGIVPLYRCKIIYIVFWFKIQAYTSLIMLNRCRWLLMVAFITPVQLQNINWLRYGLFVGFWCETSEGIMRCRNNCVTQS